MVISVVPAIGTIIGGTIISPVRVTATTVITSMIPPGMRSVVAVIVSVGEPIGQHTHCRRSYHCSGGINHLLRVSVGIVGSGATHSKAAKHSGQYKTAEFGVHSYRTPPLERLFKSPRNFSEKLSRGNYTAGVSFSRPSKGTEAPAASRA